MSPIAKPRQPLCPTRVIATALLIPALQLGTQRREACRRVSSTMHLAWVRGATAKAAVMLVKDENWGEEAFGLIFPRNGWKIRVVS